MEFKNEYLAGIPTEESVEKYERAFNAAMAYERNCRAKYDYPDFLRKASIPPIKGERMVDFAFKFRTTIKEMKSCERQVDKMLAKEKL